MNADPPPGSAAARRRSKRRRAWTIAIVALVVTGGLALALNIAEELQTGERMAKQMPVPAGAERRLYTDGWGGSAGNWQFGPSWSPARASYLYPARLGVDDLTLEARILFEVEGWSIACYQTRPGDPALDASLIEYGFVMGSKGDHRATWHIARHGAPDGDFDPNGHMVGEVSVYPPSRPYDPSCPE